MIRSTIAMAMMAVVVSGCGDKPQSAGQGPAKKADSAAWSPSQSPYVAEGWKAGDQAGWEAQLRARAQSQNEYSRIAAVPSAGASAPQ
jgi:hypothetical protein